MIDIMKSMLFASISERVMVASNTDSDLLFSRSKKGNLVYPRTLIVGKCLEVGLINEDLAYFLDRDHATISHYLKIHTFWEVRNKDYKQLIEKYEAG